MADGGDADAQVLAAELFFEGKGVEKNDEQGVKYAAMAAAQGSEKAIKTLAQHYEEKDELTKAFNVLVQNLDSHPYMKKGELGEMLGWYYINGLGTDQDEDKGWSIIEKCDGFEVMLKNDNSRAFVYWTYLKKKEDLPSTDGFDILAGKLEDTDLQRYSLLVNWLDSYYYAKNPGELEKAADNGSVWAMNHISESLYKRGSKERAILLARESAEAGSAKGKQLLEKYTFVPIEYKEVTVRQLPSRFYIESVVMEYDIMHVNFRFDNTFSSTLTTPQDTHVECDGKSYKLVSSTLPMYPNKKSINYNQTYKFTFTFERIPTYSTSFNVVADKGTWTCTDIRFKK